MADLRDQQAYGDLLDLVYDAALETQLWTKVIEAVADALNGAGGALVEQNQADGSGDAIFARADPEVIDAYFSYPVERNALLHMDDPHAFMRDWRPLILTDEDWTPKEMLVRTDYYNDFLRRVDAHSVLMIRLAAQDLTMANINIGRQQGKEQFGPGDIAFVETLQPHLIRAFKLGRRLAGTQQLSQELAQILDGSPHGLILADETGRVRRLNRTAERLVASRDALSIVAGRLHGATPKVTQRLEALIAGASRREATLRFGGSLALPSPSGRPPLSATVSPVAAERLALFQAAPSVLICVTDLEAGVRLPADHLRELFGLTRAESRVALALFEGATPRRAAESLGLSFHTVRAHLTQIFQKTGVTRQSELVRLMLKSAGLQPGP
ncbi:MAG: helix-turn-helix transcriptional regulator [Caulobacterales bacterium]